MVLVTAHSQPAAATRPPPTHQVVVNHEEQYSIWLLAEPLPTGWRAEGTRGTEEECLAHIGRVWTDMRPLSIRSGTGGGGPGQGPSGDAGADAYLGQPLEAP